MGNLLDYLHQFESRTFTESPFNEADNLALSQLAYCDLSQATAAESAHACALPCAWQNYRQSKSIAHDDSLPSSSERVFEVMAKSRRYEEVKIAWFEQYSNETAHEQFSAYTALIPDGSVCIVFRGTDNRISAWRENFMMSYMVVGAQSRARRYLNAVGCRTYGRLRICGHSKGGNLAAYAAATCSRRIRPRIDEVWCNDSPGFVHGVVDFSALGTMAKRMRLFVPEFCVVAGIMEQVVEPVVIRSIGARYLQHDLMNWQIEDGRLVRSMRINPASQQVGRIFHWLVYAHDRPSRVRITNELFDALERAGIRKIYDFIDKRPAKAVHLARQYFNCCKQTRNAVTGVLAPLVRIEAAAALLRRYARAAQHLAFALSPSHVCQT